MTAPATRRYNSPSRNRAAGETRRTHDAYSSYHSGSSYHSDSSYSDSPGKEQAQLVEAAIDQKAQGIVVTLGAPFADATVKAKEGAGSTAEVDTFDLHAAVVKCLGSGAVGFAVDQWPYLQGYLAIDRSWLNRTHGNVLGGGEPALTGPPIGTADAVPELEKHTARGTR